MTNDEKFIDVVNIDALSIDVKHTQEKINPCIFYYY